MEINAKTIIASILYTCHQQYALHMVSVRDLITVHVLLVTVENNVKRTTVLVIKSVVLVFVVDVEIVSVQTTVLVIHQSTMDQIVKSITALECK
jgi:hypothetical protein